MDIAFFAAALTAGSLLAVQASANLQLTRAVGSPLGGSTVQLSIAALLLVVLATATGSVGAIRHAAEVPVWQLLGGLASPLYITAGILLFPRLGALVAVGLFVTGQMFASLGLDVFGLLGVPQRSLNTGIALGAVAVLAGIAVIIRGQSTQPRPVRLGRRTGWVLLGIAAGAGLPVQGAVNARLRDGIGEPLAVALVSFTVAALGIGLVLVLVLLSRSIPRPRLGPTAHMPWWGWLGAACAAAYVTAMFVLIPVIGAATTVALTVAGQQVASAVIDGRGLLRMPRRVLTPNRLGGVVLITAGSALIQLG